MPSKIRKKRIPRVKRSIPSLVKLLAHCVHPEYRRDFQIHRQAVREVRCPKCDTIQTLKPGNGPQGKKCKICSKPLDSTWLLPDEFDKKYPNTALKPPNPFLISDEQWIKFASNNEEIPPKVVIALGRIVGATEGPEDGKSFVGDPDDPLRVLSAFLEHKAEGPPTVKGEKPSIEIIPVGVRIPQENPLPPTGYRKFALENLSKERWLRLEIDLHHPRPTLEKRFRVVVEEYQRHLNLDGRNRGEMLKFLALYRVTEIAKEERKSPQVILHPGKFKVGRRVVGNAKEWVAANKIFSNARKRANEIFEIAVLPEKEEKEIE